MKDMREKLSFGFRIWSILLVASLLFGLIPATLARAVSSDNTEETVWKLANPANLTVGKSYIVVSEHGALTNAQVQIPTPGDVTGDTQLGMATTPVSIENGVITSKVNADMIWQFGQGKNSAEADAEADNLGEGSGYQLLIRRPAKKQASCR